MTFKFDELAIQDPAVVSAFRELALSLEAIERIAGISVFFKKIEDDGTYEFTLPSITGVCLVTTSATSGAGTSADTKQAMLAYDANSTIQWSPVVSDVSLGNTVNPDVDGDVNIWVSGNKKLSVKNRVGNARNIAVYHFGMSAP